ncbi:hypothetical protein DPMN_037473 [Dreissena polymorpha]|uniref:Uncharacterized protein n=1 Tax=Dreissena polymorpha TaxID=45954 RepID=A0A9D4RMD3_DREPO|nr:hypothetical protein DPMN_037473 [Dreissena polymorpha]
MFMELKGPKHSKTAASMLMMLVEEQSITKHRLLPEGLLEGEVPLPLQNQGPKLLLYQKPKISSEGGANQRGGRSLTSPLLGPATINTKSFRPSLGLAWAHRTANEIPDAKKYYNEVIAISPDVKILKEKFKNKTLQQVYAGVNGRNVNDPEMQQFFKFKCWI